YVTDEGSYMLQVTNSFGSITSATVYLAATLPLLLSEPQDLRARTNWTVALGIDVLSPSAVSYRWFKNGVEISNQVSATLPFSPLQQLDAGDYVVQVSNVFGVVPSRAATVTVLPSQVIWPEPSVV